MVCGRGFNSRRLHQLRGLNRQRLGTFFFAVRIVTPLSRDEEREQHGPEVPRVGGVESVGSKRFRPPEYLLLQVNSTAADAERANQCLNIVPGNQVAIAGNAITMPKLMMSSTT